MTKPAGIARSTTHKGQPWPMFVSSSGLKILNIFSFLRRNSWYSGVTVTLKTLLEILGPWYKCHTYWFISIMSLGCQQSSVNCPLFWRRQEPNIQMARVCNGWVQDTQKGISATSMKEAEAMKRGDRPKGLFKATKLRVAKFEGERPFLTKIEFECEVSLNSQIRNYRFFFSSLEIKKPCRAHT